MSISPDTIEAIRQRSGENLVAIIAENVQLKRVGKEYKASCPFGHADKTPSFTVVPAKGFYHCHSCGAHGDAIDWLQKVRGLEFQNAVKELGDRLGVLVTDESNGNGKRESEWVTLNGISYPADMGRLVKAYTYTDEEGNPLHRTLRFDPKTFRQNFYNAAEDKWVWKEDKWTSPRWVLYKLPAIKKTTAANGTVFLVEGEKDADNLVEAFKLCGTTPAKGANKPWLSSYTESLRGARTVVIIADNDEPGRKHADTRASELTSAGLRVKVVILPGGGKDFSDWLSRGGTLDQFVEIVKSAKFWEQPEPVASAPPVAQEEKSVVYKHDLAQGFVNTDLANAKRLSFHFGDELRYAKERGWFYWTGTHWEADEVGIAQEYAKETSRRILSEVSVAPFHLRTDIEKHAPKTQSVGALGAMLKTAATDRAFALRYTDFDEPDRSALLFNCSNGTIDLTTGELREHRREDLISRLSPVEFNQNSKCPFWLEHLGTIFDGDDDLINYFQEYAGYLLTGRTDEHCLAYLYGGGANGKSVTVSILQFILGTYGITTPADTFMQKTNHGIRNDIARTAGARLVVSSEINAGERLDESLVKLVTGGDVVSARFLNREFFEFKPQFKVLMTGNSRPRIAGMDHGIRRRIHLIPFTVQIPDSKRIPESSFLSRAKAEASGILNWMIAGNLRRLKDGLKMSKRAQDATDDYFASMDPTKTFVEEKCELAPEGVPVESVSVSVKTLYLSYREYCEDSGVRPTSAPRFREIMKQKGYELKTVCDQPCFIGIRLK